ncbi:ninja-family protein 3-like [Dendrobium catenatum]|uniref:Ninja-family protein n=1 Tax=Dendrobium catenatum TaxID=906689 RepID=A0A2I0WIG8_9ASPA|nr:ninja-family protein 3-like [Dendrobium catenatum]PKU75428.1 Ninja-family protein AFP1 [Dendrobium catenatum]
MELDLTGRLEKRTVDTVAMDSPAVVEENGMDARLELSLRLSSGEVGSRKRVRESDEAVEAKKPKMEEGPVPYALQFIPVILQAPNGYCYVSMMPCWVPSSVDAVENSVYEPRGNRSLVAEMDGVAAGDCQAEAAGRLSSQESSISRTSVLQSLSAKGESSSSTESRSHSSGATTDNTSHISSFRNSKPGLKKPPTPTKGRKKPALRRKRGALVSTQSSEGKKINGCLYQCSESEVRILCDCHGSFFSPADFVKHAGGPETQHPLRQITVALPS